MALISYCRTKIAWAIEIDKQTKNVDLISMTFWQKNNKVNLEYQSLFVTAVAILHWLSYININLNYNSKI